MGNVESRFGTLLVQGKEEEAMEQWKENFELQTRFQPNTQIKASQYRDTPLHCTVRFEMKELMVEFLSMGGDPFSTNALGETPLHIVCRAAKISSRRSRKRAELLRLLLDRIPSEETFEVVRSMEAKKSDWKSASVVSSGADRDTHHLGMQDKSRNTPLHLAATSGLLECVELLVAHNAPLFVQNIAGQTPCDVAWDAKQIIIAKQLESKMVLDSDITQSTKVPGESTSVKRTRNKTFHNTQTLKILQEDIITRIAQKLQVTHHSARALLMTYGWSEELLCEAWKSDREVACEKAGIEVPGSQVSINSIPPPSSLTNGTTSMEQECGICYCEILSVRTIRVPCQHMFCEDCWRMFVEGQIDEGGGKEIRCPEVNCFQIVPDDVIAKLVSEGQMEKYTELTIKQFVDSSSHIRWCPYPDCGYAICMKREESREESSGEMAADEDGAVGKALGKDQLTRGENVECGQGHGFCWNCKKDPHEPCSCELWGKWKEVVMSNMSEEDKSRVAGEAKANAQWITRNTKPCPNCSSPIQKNEGCNHMTCKTCRHDFCWVCLDPWNVHSHRTGGYFTCNRWGAQSKAEKAVKQMQMSLEREYVTKAYHEMEEQQAKFEHYHDRYNNHLQSLDIETRLLQESKAKLREMERLGQALDKKVALVRAKVLMDTVEFAEEACRSFPNLQGKNFLDDVFRSLLHSRRVLAASYCIGYFLPEEKREAQQAHEALQGKLEDAVEMLSQMVNREYLHTTQQRMDVAARNVDFLCDEYLVGMKGVADIAGMFVMGIEDEDQRRIREEREERERQEEEAGPPPTLEELLFFEHLIRLMDGGNGRVHILLPPAANGQ